MPRHLTSTRLREDRVACAAFHWEALCASLTRSFSVWVVGCRQTSAGASSTFWYSATTSSRMNHASKCSEVRQPTFF